MARRQATLDALQELRADLEAAIGNVGNLATQAQLDAAIAAEQTARQALADRISTVEALVFAAL